MASAKPSALAIGLTKGRDPKASPRTSDIDLPNLSGQRDPRLNAPVERPLMDYDRGRAKRQMSRPISGGRR